MATSNDLAQIWGWNESVPVSIDRCVHEVIQERIDAQLAAPAICAWDGDLTYGELGRLATGLAGRLVEIGVGPGTASIIPLCFEKSMWTAVAMLGVLKAGAAFVLIDPHQPERRLQNIVRQTEAKVIVSSCSNGDLSSRLAPHVVVLSSHFATTLHDQLDSHFSLPDPSSAAYIAFTSGSTGEPKGAVITHQNMASALHHQMRDMRLTSTTRFYDFSSYSFDASIGVFFTTLSAGGCICVPSEDDRRDNLIQSIISLNANIIDLTPSVAALLSPELVPCLQTLILGGEALQVRDVSPWWGKVRIVSFYGPCECSPTSTINGDPCSKEHAVDLGKGSGLVTWIVDPENHNVLVPIGSVGELLLEGPLVGRGYLHDPERTRAVFIEDPLWLLEGAPGRQGRRGRLYKTGDLVRYRDDGSLIFCGRKDAQVKIRGQRIELGEIENTLINHPGVNEAVAVLQKDDSSQDEWIASFVTVHNHGAAFEGAYYMELWARQFNGGNASIEDTLPRAVGRDFTKWESMYDGSDINMVQIGEWLAGTIDPMISRGEVGRIPEVVRSSEMILFNLSSHGLENPVRLEPHTGAVKFITKIVESIPGLADKITVLKATSADLGPCCAAISSGLVVLNSIIQYFPSQAYLTNVVKEALKLDGVKTVIFSDIRSKVLHRESLAERAVHIAGGRMTRDDFRGIIDMNLDESELLVDPAFFSSLADSLPDQIEHVEVLPKDSNGLGAFRYEAVIHVRTPSFEQQQIRQVGQLEWIDFKEQGLNRQSLSRLLHQDSSQIVIPVRNIPYSRSILGGCFIRSFESQGDETANSIDWISNARKQAHHHHSLSVADLVELATDTCYRVKVSCDLQSSQHGGLDAIFYHHQLTNDKRRVLFQFPHEDDRILSRGSLCSQLTQKDLSQKIEDQLLQMLRTKLPSYMVPRVIKTLDAMPLNKNCKIDRRTLAQNLQRKKSPGRLVRQPEIIAEAESQICQIWGNALAIEPTTIGLNDRFFDIGGDSIKAMKVVLEAQKHGIEITVRDVFFLEVHEMARKVFPHENNTLGDL